MKKFLGYTVINTKTERFVMCPYSEDEESFESWKEKDGAQETLDEIDWFIKNHNNKQSRHLKKQRKHIKIAKLFVEAK